MAKQQLLKIEQVKIDEELYPRANVDFVTCARYLNALKSGEQFPPIIVAKLEEEYYLVDGAHRLQANKNNKETHIQTEVLEGLNRQEIFLEAVKRNITHGRQFSTYEVTSICITLDKWNMSQEEISEIVRIPATDIKPFVAKRMMRITGTNEEIPLKASLRNLAGTETGQEIDQKGLIGARQVQLISSLNFLFKRDLIDTENKLVKRELKKLHKSLNKYFTKK